MPAYFLLLSDQVEVGPLEDRHLAALLREGQIPSATPVRQEEESRFIPAAERADCDLSPAPSLWSQGRALLTGDWATLERAERAARPSHRASVRHRDSRKWPWTARIFATLYGLTLIVYLLIAIRGACTDVADYQAYARLEREGHVVSGKVLSCGTNWERLLTLQTIAGQEMAFTFPDPDQPAGRPVTQWQGVRDIVVTEYLPGDEVDVLVTKTAPYVAGLEPSLSSRKGTWWEAAWVAVSSLGVVFLLVRASKKRGLLPSRGRVTSGLIVDVWKGCEISSEAHCVAYQFTAENGEIKMDQESTLDPRIFAGLRVGSPVRVRFLADAPRWNELLIDDPMPSEAVRMTAPIPA